MCFLSTVTHTYVFCGLDVKVHCHLVAWHVHYSVFHCFSSILSGTLLNTATCADGYIWKCNGKIIKNLVLVWTWRQFQQDKHALWKLSVRAFQKPVLFWFLVPHLLIMCLTCSRAGTAHAAGNRPYLTAVVVVVSWMVFMVQSLCILCKWNVHWDGGST